MKKFALYPFAAKTSDFKVGQTVQQLITSSYGSSFVGIIVAVHPSIDKIDVQWPHQVGRHSPEDLIPVTEALGIRPTVVDLLIPSHNNPEAVSQLGGLPSSAQLAVVNAHLKKLAKAMKIARSSKKSGFGEVKSFSKVSSVMGDMISDEDIRLIVASLYNKDIAEENAVYLTVIHDLIDG